MSSGDAAPTRRSRKYSTLAAVVLKWSRARKRYERQGLLVEEQALQRAEAECLNDAEFGAWAIGGFWGQVDDEQSMRALHAAIDEGASTPLTCTASAAASVWSPG